MSMNQTIYVLDTNVLVDYVDIIPGIDSKKPINPTIDLSEAQIVIPSVVVRELSSFKKESSDRGIAARTILRRLRYLAERESYKMDDVYSLKTLSVEHRITILPVHKNFHECLPFHPADDDMDGQIILTALTVVALQNEYSINGTASELLMANASTDNVVLITNDNGLAIRARERGIKTLRYGYQYPEEYTGRRNIEVPSELFKEFYDNGQIPLETWVKFMPDEPELVANEFIVMKIAEGDYPQGYEPEYDPCYSYIGKYDASDEMITRLKYVRDFPISVKNPGQAIYAEALMDPKIAAIVCYGPAGSGKTYMATVYGYYACKDGEFIGVTVVPCDSKSKLGALPGDLDEKMDPEVQPLKNALRNYLLCEDASYRKDLQNMKRFGTGAEAKKKAKSQGCDGANCTGERRSLRVRLTDHVNLIWENWFTNIPIEHARGRDFAYELAIFDEFQDQTVSQADTLIKRIGTDGKIVITGDIKQIHAPYIDETSSGLTYASRTLKGFPIVAQVCFTEEEVIRHPLVRLVAMRQK